MKFHGNNFVWQNYTDNAKRGQRKLRWQFYRLLNLLTTTKYKTKWLSTIHYSTIIIEFCFFPTLYMHGEQRTFSFFDQIMYKSIFTFEIETPFDREFNYLQNGLLHDFCNFPFQNCKTCKWSPISLIKTKFTFSSLIM